VRLRLDTNQQRLDRAAQRLRRPAEGVRRHAHGLRLLEHRLAASVRQVARGRVHGQQALAARLKRSLEVTLASRRQRLEGLAARLAGLDPSRVLSRGYAWLTDASGAPVTSVSSLSVGQAARAVLADGHADVTVQAVVAARPSTDPS